MSSSSSQNRQGVAVDICICTFRRPEIEATIRSLAALDVPDGARVRIVVADNDVGPSAESRVRRLSSEITHPVIYRHVPAQNISLARNACLDVAAADFVAFIDDDETASPQWLAELLLVAEASGADAVLGPVRAVYAQGAPAWMRQADIHATLPVFVKGEILTGYTCNVLLRLSSPAVAGRRFALALGRSGGEDTDFFSGLHAAGGTIAYAPQAVVEEPVPASRARFSWLARRRFRMGQTHGRIVMTPAGGASRVKAGMVAVAKAVACLLGAVANGLSAARRNRFLLRAILHAGVVGGLFGVREITQYGEIDAAKGRANAA